MKKYISFPLVANKKEKRMQNKKKTKKKDSEKPIFNPTSLIFFFFEFYHLNSILSMKIQFILEIKSSKVTKSCFQKSMYEFLMEIRLFFLE